MGCLLLYAACYRRFFRSFFSGTGSYPPLLQGLHRKIRQIVSKLPLKAPKRSMACIPYSEQVGIYLHMAGFLGEMALR